MEIAIIIILLIFFMFIGMPIAFALGFTGSIGLLVYGGWDTAMGILQTSPHGTTASFLLTTVPMYILMAEFLNKSDIIKDFYYSSHKWLGHYKGGLGISAIFAGAGMGAVCGSSVASASTMASTGYPEMKKYGYNTSFAMGIVSSSGTLAILIPPSLALIIYGILTDVPIGHLLIAGLVPGIITAIGYIITIRFMIAIKPDLVRKSVEPAPFKERVYSLKNIWPTILLIIIIISVIFLGVATVTEAGAFGAFSALVLGLVMKRLTIKGMKEAFLNTLETTTKILALIVGAMIFGYFLTITQVTQNIINFASTTELSKWTILLMVCLLYLILGLFLDGTAILLLTIPLTFPLMMALDFSPIWYGVIVTKLIEIGLLTPPLGMNVFVASSAAGVGVDKSFKGVMPFIACEVVLIAILIAFPSITTFLPELNG